MSRGLIIAAPASATGKTTITLGLLRALKRAGMNPHSLKVGPDYLDPGFHRAASGAACLNLDMWAMRPGTFANVVHTQQAAGQVVVAEGVMGLFDGATPSSGSTADVAAATGWPVILVVDAGGMSSSIAALVHGFATFRADVQLAGVIANRVGSARHTQLLREALAPLGIPLLGSVPRDTMMSLPSRHLGLVMADEHAALDEFLEHAADVIAANVDVDGLIRIMSASRLGKPPAETRLVPLAQRIAIAKDVAFGFVYPHQLSAWRSAGAEIQLFSPLANETPAVDAEAIFLPGGYPELHAAALAANTVFLDGLRSAANRGARIYGECGGFMTLGETLQDADGAIHRMAGLLPLETTFAKRKMQLGYRAVEVCSDSVLGARGTAFKGHEFHFAQVLRSGAAEPLFRGQDARGNALGEFGLQRGQVCGSFIHLVDEA